MNIESFLPFLLLLAPFFIGFFLEALVLYFFRLKPFWTSLGISVALNLISLVLIYFVAAALLSMLGYEVGNFNGLNLSLPVVAFLWWFSSVAEGFLLVFVFRLANVRRTWLAAITMNLFFFLFLYIFIVNSH